MTGAHTLSLAVRIYAPAVKFGRAEEEAYMIAALCQVCTKMATDEACSSGHQYSVPLYPGLCLLDGPIHLALVALL